MYTKTIQSTKGQHGPTELPPLYSPFVDFVDLLFLHVAMSLLADQTNIYAHRREKEWDNGTTVEEIRAVLGIL